MPRRNLLILAALAALVVGIGLTIRPRGVERPATEPAAEARVELPGIEELAAGEVPPTVLEFLEQGRNWRAALVLREYLDRQPGASPLAVLLAARTEAEWGGWQRARRHLEGRPWLDELAAGEGWYWLARAREEDEEWDAALEAYARFLEVAPAGVRGNLRQVARLRHGLILLRRDRTAEGADQLEGMRGEPAALEPWLDLLAAEALTASGDTAGVRRLTASAAEVTELRPRAWRAVMSAHEAAGDRPGARQRARAYRSEAGEEAVRAELAFHAGRLGLALGDTAGARAELRAAMQEAPGSTGARQAAGLLAGLRGLAPEDHRAIAGTFERHGNAARAAAAYRAWLGTGAGTPAERRDARLRLGRALFNQGDNAGAETELRPLQAGEDRVAADALLLIGRAQIRRGNRAAGTRTFEELARRFPGSAPGSEGLYLIADFEHDAQRTAQAARLYRRVASEFPGTDRAELSLMRLAGMRYLARAYREAAAIWEEYRTSYPQGVRWLEATYWAGRSYEAMGDTAAARARYRGVKVRDPISYYSLRASERLGESFWPIPMAAAPPENPAARARVEEWMRGIDLLRDAGLFADAELEADRWIAAAGDDATLLYPLAETLNERGYTLRGIRIAQRLQRAEEQPNPRLLRILYPFPYRALVETESRERRLDPFLVAGLTRQESLFMARITSPVGAQGLMQIMPGTGAALARGVGIGQWDAELLYQPEINVHLGTLYLAEQMSRYDGSLPSVFAAYNAGPRRVEQWSRYPEYRRDEELFTERIPFRETRDYVKILTRNIALYHGLYGAP
jgi:soluble lytic murein transglycosylase